jgi:tetratricopeptide (TPR) repeat protein
MLAVIFRKTGASGSADSILDSLEQLDPLNHRIRFERYMLQPDSGTWNHFLDYLKAEFVQESLLETAIHYFRLGLLEESALLLRIFPDLPLHKIWLAYILKEQEPEKSHSLLTEAAKLSPGFLFPFREETIPVLQWAVQTLPDEWKLKYYLSLILWGKYRKDEALALMRECNSSDYAPFWLAFSVLDPGNAESHLKKALSLDPGQWRCHHHLARFYLNNGKFGEALRISRKAVNHFPHMGTLQMDLVRSLFSAGNFRECSTIMDTLQVLPYEGGWEAHHLFMKNLVHLAMEEIKSGHYSKAKVLLTKSMDYPERLGTGRPYNPDLRIQNALLSLVSDLTGEKELADKFRKLVVDYTFSSKGSPAVSSIFAYWILRDRGRTRQAGELLDFWKEHTHNQVFHWLSLKGDGKIRAARRIEESMRTRIQNEPGISAANFYETWNRKNR